MYIVLSVSKASKMSIIRDEQQSITAVIDAKLSVEDAFQLLKILAEQLAVYHDGMGPITFSLEGKRDG